MWPLAIVVLGIAQAALHGGANDFGQVMIEENVVSAAGTTYSMTAQSIERAIREAGFGVFRRDVHYQPIAPRTQPKHQELDCSELRSRWMDA